MSWHKFAQFSTRAISEHLRARMERRKQIYILPTKFGMLFLMGAVVMILIGSAYQNNSVNLMGFFCLAFSFTAMIATQKNLKRVDVVQLDPISGFAGEQIPVTCVVRNESRRTIASHIQFAVAESLFQLAANYDARAEIRPRTEKRLLATVQVPQRGIRVISRVRLSSDYPYGLYRAWTYRPVHTESVIYPSRQPIQLNTRWLNHEGQKVHANQPSGAGGDELEELAPLVSGESQRGVDWKLYARRGLLARKHFTNPVNQALILKLPTQFQSFDEQERILVELSSQVSAALELRMPIGLESAFEKIRPNASASTAKSVLRRLAGWASTEDFKKPRTRSWRFWSSS